MFKSLATLALLLCSATAFAESPVRVLAEVSSKDRGVLSHAVLLVDRGSEEMVRLAGSGQSEQLSLFIKAFYGKTPDRLDMAFSVVAIAQLDGPATTRMSTTLSTPEGGGVTYGPLPVTGTIVKFVVQKFKND